MKKILVAGYYGYQNSGDDAILHSICSDLLQLDINTSITVLSKRPELTMNEYPVEAVQRFSLVEIIEEIKVCDVLVMGGGSLIQDMTSTRSLYYYLAIIALAKLFKKPCMLYGNGIGPIKHKFNKPFTRWLLNKVEMITLREHLSLRMLKRLGIDQPMIKVTADPVFNLQINANINYEEIYKIESIPRERPMVAVMFRSWNHEASYTRHMAAICDRLIGTYDYEVVFVPMKHPADLSVSMEIMKKMKYPAYIIKHRYSEEKLIRFIGDMSLVLSMRLHALIYGALYGRLMLGFNYDPKVEYYAKELGVPYVESMDNIQVDEVMKKIEGLLSNQESYTLELNQRVEQLKQKAHLNQLYLRKLL